MLRIQREEGIADMELGERFRVQRVVPSGERAQRAINALLGMPVWCVEVIRKKAPERSPTAASAPAHQARFERDWTKRPNLEV